MDRRCLERELELAHRHDHPLSLLIVDVDLFKQVNDSLGHSAGDAVLKCLTPLHERNHAF